MFAIFFMWRLITQYNSIFLVSLIPSLSLLGYITISIPEGYLLDKFDRSKIMFISTIIIFSIYSLLLFFHSLLLIYLVDLLSSIFSIISADIFYTIVKDVVSSQEMSKIMAYNAIGAALAQILGTVLGGLSAAFDPAIFPVLLTIISLVAIPLAYPVKFTIYKTKEELNYSHVSKIIKIFLPFLLISLVINGIFVAIDVFASGYFYDILHSGALGYTAFLLAYSIGSLIGGIIGNRVSGKLDNPRIFALIIASFSFLFYSIALVKIVYIQPIFTLLLGIGVSLINIPIQATLTRLIPTEIFGRTNSAIMIFLTSVSPFMAIIYGILSNFLSLETIFLILGTLLLVTSVPTFITANKLLKLREEDIRKILKV